MTQHWHLHCFTLCYWNGWLDNENGSTYNWWWGHCEFV